VSLAGRYVHLSSPAVNVTTVEAALAGPVGRGGFVYGRPFGVRSGEPAGQTVPTIVLKDNKPGSTFYAPINWMVTEGIAVGYTDGTFRSRREITRGEVATMLYRYYAPEFTVPEMSPFPDLSPDSAYYEAITWMKSEGLVDGYVNAEFQKDRYISRGEAANILYRMNAADTSFRYTGQDSFKDIDGRMSKNHYSIYWLHWAGLADGYADGTFRRHLGISCGEFAKMLHRYELKIGK
jgi:hypothetical protein